MTELASRDPRGLENVAFWFLFGEGYRQRLTKRNTTNLAVGQFISAKNGPTSLFPPVPS